MVIDVKRKTGAKFFHSGPLIVALNGHEYYSRPQSGVSHINLVWPGRYYTNAEKWTETTPEVYRENPGQRGGYLLFQFSQKVNPAATDGKRGYVHPEKWKSLSIPARFFIACHELAHANGEGNDVDKITRELFCDKYAADWYLFRGLPPSLLQICLLEILSDNPGNQKRIDQMDKILKGIIK